jgi:hypothetical protein
MRNYNLGPEEREREKAGSGGKRKSKIHKATPI